MSAPTVAEQFASTANAAITGSADLKGTLREPYLVVTFPYGARHATRRSLTLQDWVRALPGRRWDPDENAWSVNSLGPDPDKVLAEAGVELILPKDGELAGIRRLGQLYDPVTMLSSDNRTVLVRPRLMGTKGVQEITDGSAVWDRKRKLLKVPVSDVVLGASPRAGIPWDAKSIARAYEVHSLSPSLDSDLDGHVAALANALDPKKVASHIHAIQDHLGGPVGTFGVQLYPYQIIGAYAVAGGHTLLADSPGVGKTFQALAAAAALRYDRLLVICPPVVLTNWKREVAKAEVASSDRVAVFIPSKKEPALRASDWKRPRGKKAAANARFVMPKVVIVADSTLAARPDTVASISQWLGEAGKPLIAYDEAHRMKTMGSARSNAVLDLRSRVPHARAIAITGTPLLSGPHELVPILEFTGHLAPVFGGAGPFLKKYCRQDRYGAWHPMKRALPQLHKVLNDHVWVRRTKDDVLPFLPKRMPPREVVVDVKLTEYRKTHKDVIDTITEWVKGFRKENGRWPTPDEQKEYAEDNLRFASQLRHAAGLTKVPAAIEMVAEHVAGNPDRPILVWAHHQDVIAALKDAAGEAGFTFGVIDGSVTGAERDRVVDEFQAGKLSALFLSITAAGVGITLTRASDVLFVESDWTPAIMLQAIDRAHRIGQERTVWTTVMTAEGTLDEHVQAKLAEKGATLETVFGDDSNNIAIDERAEAAISPRDIVWGMVQDVVDRLSA